MKVLNWIPSPSPEPSRAKFLAYRIDESDGSDVFIGNFLFHKHLAEAVGAQKEWVLVAAGDVSPDCKITSWKSSGFGFETPENNREAMENFLLENKGIITKNWQW